MFSSQDTTVSGQEVTTQMISRREAVRLLGSGSAGAWFAAALSEDGSPSLGPGSPMSPERIALIEAFKKRSEGLEKNYEARTHKSDLVMPYRLFRPEATGKLPLVMYLHGSGGLGGDHFKKIGLGNVFGTRVWLLPGKQK